MEESVLVCDRDGPHRVRHAWTTVHDASRGASFPLFPIRCCGMVLTEGRLCLSGPFISFDADLPLEVDDEYWENEDPELAFRQPEGKPSRVTAYNLWLRLTDIIDLVLRTFVRFSSPI